MAKSKPEHIEKSAIHAVPEAVKPIRKARKAG